MDIRKAASDRALLEPLIGRWKLGGENAPSMEGEEAVRIGTSGRSRRPYGRHAGGGSRRSGLHEVVQMDHAAGESAFVDELQIQLNVGWQRRLSAADRHR